MHIKVIYIFIFLIVLIKLSLSQNCMPENAKLKLPPKLQRNNQYKFEISHGKVPPLCTITTLGSELRYKWSITQMSKPPKDVSAMISGKSETTGKFISINLCCIKPEWSFYQYELQATALIKPHNVKVMAKFRVFPYQVEPLIEGTNARELTMGPEGFVLNGSASQDRSYEQPYKQIHPDTHKATWKCVPPLPGNEPPQGELTWKIKPWSMEKEEETYDCTLTIVPTKQLEPAKQSFTQKLKIKKPFVADIRVMCLENCESANPYKETVLTWKCEQGCDEQQGQWSINPPNETVEYYPANLAGEPNAIKFSRNTFKPGDKINFVVTAGKLQANLTINYREIKLQLNLTCISNCELFDPRSDIDIMAECCSYDADCQGKPGCPCDKKDDCVSSDFEWSMQPVISLDHFIGSDGHTLKIPRDTLQDETDFNVTIKSYNNLDTISFKTMIPAPTIAIVCTLELQENNLMCSSADARDPIQLEVSCSNYCEGVKYAWSASPNDVGFEWEKHTSPDLGSLRIDPETFQNNSTIEFTVVAGKSTEKYEVHFQERIPIMKIECLKNCKNDADPLKETVLKGSCQERCTYATYLWSVDGAQQPLQKTWLQDNDTLLTIPANLVEDGKEISVVLSSSSNQDVWKKTFIEPTPHLEIECVTSCQSPPNPLAPFTLRVTCTEPEQDSTICSIVSYKWDLNPKPENFSWAARVIDHGENVTLREASFNDTQQITVEVIGRKGKASKALQFVEPIPVIKLICTDNCQPAHTSIPVKFEVNCTSNCLGISYIWTLAPEPKESSWIKSIILGENNMTLTIKESVYADKDIVEVGVIARKAKESIKTTFEMIPPEFDITCDPSCEAVHNPLQRLHVEATCSKFCSAMGKDKIWSFDPTPKDFNWTKSVVILKNNDSLLILPEAFEDETNVTILVEDGKEGKGNVTISFLAPTPNITITCEKNCWDGDPLQETILFAKCLQNCENATAYIWEMDPMPGDWKKNISMGPDNTSITINAETYKDGDVVNVTLLMRKGNATNSIKYIEQRAGINLTCRENCTPYHPLRNIVFGVKCEHYCLKEEYVWTIEPLPEKFDWKKQIILDSNNWTLTLLANTFNDSDSTAVTVTNRKATKTIVINFVETPSELSMNCLFNCENGRSDPLRPMMFNVSCTNDCDRVKYLWHLLPPPPKIDWTKDVTFGKDNATFYLKENVYHDEGSTRIKVESYKSEVYLDVEFDEPTPQLKLSQNCTPETCLPCNDTGCYPNPYEPIAFTAECISSCENLTLVWEVNPELRDFSWNKHVSLGSQNASLTIIKGTYLERERAIIRVKSRKGVASVNLTYVVPPPSLTLTCYSNCPEANIFQSVAFTVECKYECEKFTYEWSTDPPQPVPWKNYMDQTKEEGHWLLTVKKSLFQDGEVVTFTGSNEKVSGNLTITFIEHPPEIEIICEKNCAFNPRNDVKLVVKCLKHCDELNYSWTLQPPSEIIEQKANSDVLVIKTGSFPDNASVSAVVKVRKAEATFNVSYQLPNWNGQCVIEPDTGISGITKFSIECEDFAPRAFFRVYQKSINDNTTGVLLTYGRETMSLPFWVSKTNGVSGGVHVMVGEDWETKADVQLNITASALSAPEELNISMKEYAQILIIGEDLGQLKYFLRRKQYFEVVQLSSLLATALKDTDEEFEGHYVKHLIATAMEIVREISPMQSIGLLTKLINGTILKEPLGVQLSAELLRVTTDFMASSKPTAIYDEANIDDFTNKAIFLCSKLLSIASLLKTETSLISEDYPFYSEMIPEKAKVDKSLKSITQDLLGVTAALRKIMRAQNGSQHYTSSKIIIATEQRNTTDMKNFIFPNSSGSYIVPPNNFQQILHSQGKTAFDYTMALYAKNPHLWKKDELNTTTDVLELSVPEITRVDRPFGVHLLKKKQVDGQQTKQKGGTIQAYSVAPKSLFTASFKFSGKPYNISLGNQKPTAFEHMITEDKNLSFYSPGKTVYVGIDAENELEYQTYEYKAADCYYWVDDSLSWRKDECEISKEQPDPRMIKCECRHLSYFAAREYIPDEIKGGTEIPAEAFDKTWFIAITSAVALVLFIFLFAWGHKEDRKHSLEGAVVGLADNIPGDNEMYMVLIATGNARHSGSTANIGISVKGSLASSRLHLLKGKKVEKIQRNKEHIFIMYSPKYLGDLQSIKLWHNSQGSKPHWYCERVMIQHVKTRKKYNFTVEQWFSLINGSGTTHGMFKVSDGNEKMPFCRRLRETIRSDHHLLSLLVQRPRAGSYKETLMVGFVSCLILMTTTMILVNYIDENSVSKLVIGLTAAMICLPVSMLLQFLLRNSP